MRPLFQRTLIVGASFAAAFGLAVGHASAHHAKYKVLHSFCAEGGDACTDGEGPAVGLTGDSAGNLYGIAGSGGANGDGVIFKLVRSGKTYTYQVLYSFPAGSGPALPGGELIVDVNGNLYGTIRAASGNPAGSVFELSIDHTYRTIYTFCTIDSCGDGENPDTPLTYVGANAGKPYDGASLLYGTTAEGGKYGNGTAFSITPTGVRNTLSNMCRFTQHDDCRSGGAPEGSIAVDSAGTMYGANSEGRALNGYGLVWSINGVLHDFCAAPPDCRDGRSPAAGVFLDPASPTLYGSTIAGGSSFDNGVAYQVSTGGGYDVLHRFCVLGDPCKVGKKHKDGKRPDSALYPDGAGSVLGVTEQGGSAGSGILYRIDLATKKLAVLYEFCADGSGGTCLDGSNPGGQLAQYGGSIFGVTTGGGPAEHPAGVVYQYTP